MKTTDTSAYFIPDTYGFWDLAGRDLFFKFPKFSFIEISQENNLESDYFIVSDFDLDDPLTEALNNQRKKIYIKTIDKKIDEQLNKILFLLPSYLLRNGKYVDGSVKIFDEIIIGVKENPELYKQIFLNKLKSDKSLSEFTGARYKKG